MMKIVLCFLVVLMLHHSCFAQSPAPVDYKKITEQLNEKLKAATEQAKKLSGQPGNVPNTNDAPQPTTKPVALKPDDRQLPVRNNTLLSQLPKKILSRNELSAYLVVLDAQLTQKIGSSSADSIKLTVKQLGNDGEKLSYAAMVAWYKNDAETAVMLATKAATLSIDNNTALSNCAALFIMAGLENKAIPILQVLLQRQPNSSTVLNNLGQAYTGLGEVDTAMYYFGRCIKIAPEHPEANNTAAIICMKKGQTEQAKNHCTQSLKGGLTTGAIETYGHLYTDDGIEKLIDIEPWKIYPFNEHDFTFPEQCEKTADATTIQSELEACVKKYKAFFEKFDRGYNAELRSKAAQMSAQYAKDPVHNLAMVNANTPYSRRALYAYHRIVTPLVQDMADLTFKHIKEIDGLKAEYDSLKKELETKRDQEIEGCGNSNLCLVKTRATHCGRENALSDRYLPKFAVINRDYVSKRWRLSKEEFEAFSVLLKMGVRHNTIQYFSEEAGRIGIIGSPLTNGEILHDGYQLIMPYCDLTDADLKRIDSMELTEKKSCNLNVEIPLGVAKITFSCDEFEIEGGELIKAKFNKNFKTGQTTLYAGVGVSEHIPGFEASATQYVFVCYDGNNQPVDVGTQGELELDVKGVVEGDQKIVLRTALNAGVSFQPGPLQTLANTLPYAFK
jgi:tetratricopeptide (TPR) repeat protein